LKVISSADNADRRMGASDVSFLGIFANLVGLVTFFGCWIYFITTFMSPLILLLFIIVAIILVWVGLSGSIPPP
jgi:mannose/fructose/N-acetylgalactosamine-specific phosphotransferase system component IID